MLQESVWHWLSIGQSWGKTQYNTLQDPTLGSPDIGLFFCMKLAASAAALSPPPDLAAFAAAPTACCLCSYSSLLLLILLLLLLLCNVMQWRYPLPQELAVYSGPGPACGIPGVSSGWGGRDQKNLASDI
jgi:hypothetical protein